MSRSNVFSFRVTNEERQIIKTLADHLQRTQSDTIRLLIRETFKQLHNHSTKPEIAKYQRMGQSDT